MSERELELIRDLYEIACGRQAGERYTEDVTSDARRYLLEAAQSRQEPRHGDPSGGGGSEGADAPYERWSAPQQQSRVEAHGRRLDDLDERVIGLGREVLHAKAKASGAAHGVDELAERVDAKSRVADIDRDALNRRISELAEQQAYLGKRIESVAKLADQRLVKLERGDA